LFFDGVCNLCNRTVQLVLKHDKKRTFRFCTLQSEAGKAAILAAGARSGTPNSVILFANDRYYLKSAAALKTAQLLGGAWSLLYAFMIVPAFIRDRIYDIVARNRYKWFGKRESCMLPTPETAGRFISS